MDFFETLIKNWIPVLVIIILIIRAIFFLYQSSKGKHTASIGANDVREDSIMDSDFSVKSITKNKKKEEETKNPQSSGHILFALNSKYSIINSSQGVYVLEENKLLWNKKFNLKILGGAISDTGLAAIALATNDDKNGIIKVLDRKGEEVCEYRTKEKNVSINIWALDISDKGDVITVIEPWSGGTDHYVAYLSDGKITSRFPSSYWSCKVSFHEDIAIEEAYDIVPEIQVYRGGKLKIYSLDRYRNYILGKNVVVLDNDVFQMPDDFTIGDIHYLNDERLKENYTEELGFSLKGAGVDDVKSFDEVKKWSVKKDSIIGVLGSHIATNENGLTLYDLKGNILWNKNINVNVMKTSGNLVCVVTDNNDLVVYNPSGSELFSKNLDLALNILSISNDEKYIITRYKDFLIPFNINGKPLSVFKIKEKKCCGVDKYLFKISSGYLEKYDFNGTLLWAFEISRIADTFEFNQYHDWYYQEGYSVDKEKLIEDSEVLEILEKEGLNVSAFK